MKTGVWYRFKNQQAYNKFRERASFNDAVGPYLAGGFKVHSMTTPLPGSVSPTASSLGFGVTEVRLGERKRDETLKLLINNIRPTNVIISSNEYEFFEEIPSTHLTVKSDSDLGEKIKTIIESGRALYIGTTAGGSLCYEDYSDFVAAVDKTLESIQFEDELKAMKIRHAKEIAELEEKLK